MTPEGDIADFKKLFSDSQLRPDMLKIYPSLVIENTPLYDDHKNGKYIPYSDEDMIKVLTEVKKNIPKWVRIMRVQREISPNEIIAGPKSGNLRQIVHQNLAKQGLKCKCIRCREAGLTKSNPEERDIKLTRIDYDSSGGKVEPTNKAISPKARRGAIAINLTFHKIFEELTTEHSKCPNRSICQ